MRSVHRSALSCALALGLFSPITLAGPLSPPPGPVSPTQRTVIDSLPYAITAPGSYIVWSNLSGIAGADGITIDANDVTLDLNGFALLGTPGAQAGIFVDTSNGNGRHVTILNGSVRDWSNDGIRAVGAPFTTIDGVWCDNNSGEGINVGDASTVVDCIVTNHPLNGITAVNGSTVIKCRTSGNLATGIFVQGGSIVDRCTAISNGDGISGSNGAVIENCTMFSNQNLGARIDLGTTISGCTIRQSGFAGIECGNECVVANNRLSLNAQSGVGASLNVVGSQNTIIGNSVVSIAGAGLTGIDVIGVQNTVYDNSGVNGLPDFQAIPGNDLGIIAPAAAGTPKSNVPH